METILKVRKPIFRTPSRVIKEKVDYLPMKKFIDLNLEGKETKYEWKDGKILLEYKMKKKERIIIDNIVTKYIFGDKSLQDKSKIMAEADVELPTVLSYRKPDAAYFTREQIIHPDTLPNVPYFLIEINSKSNTFDGVEQKLNDYFDAGVQTVWQIIPNRHKVYVYNSATDVSIKTENEMCEARLENGHKFAMSVEEIFRDFVV